MTASLTFYRGVFAAHEPAVWGLILKARAWVGADPGGSPGVSEDGEPLSDYTGIRDRGGGPLLGTPPLFLRVTRFCNVWTDAGLSRALGMTSWVGTLEHPEAPPEARFSPSAGPVSAVPGIFIRMCISG